MPSIRTISTSGSIPSITQLALGDLAVNTHDGKAYIKKQQGNVQTVLEIGSGVGGGVTQIIAGTNITISPIGGTGAVTINASSTTVSASYASTASYVNPLRQNVLITGSLNVTGSTIQVGNNTLLGNTTLSGSIIISGSTTTPATPTIKIYGDMETNGVIKFNPVVKNIDTSLTGSYIYVSGSTNDLYFSQNGDGYNNVTRLRWLEGNLYTGLLNGGLITTASSTTFNISSGSGIIVNLNASINANPYPTIQYVNWGNLTNQTLTYRTSSIQTFVGINSSGNIIQQTTPWVDGQYNTSIQIGTVLHQNKSTINAQISYPNTAYGYKQRTYDFIKAFGPLKLSGFTLVTSSSLGLEVGNGIAFADGRNYQVDPNNPSYITDPGTNTSKIFRYYQSGSEFVQDTNGGLGYTVIDPANYNPGNSGSLQPVPGTGANRQWSIQRVFWYPNSATKGIVVYYGSSTYTSEIDAAANLPYEPFNEVENTKQNAIYLGAIIIRNNGDFTTSTSYRILTGGLFRASLGGGGGGGGGGSAVSPFPFTGSAEITGSLRVIGPVTATSFTGSLSGSAISALTASYVLPLTQSVSIKGLGTTSATTALLVQNSNTSASLQVRDDGAVLARSVYIPDTVGTYRQALTEFDNNEICYTGTRWGTGSANIYWSGTSLALPANGSTLSGNTELLLTTLNGNTGNGLTMYTPSATLAYTDRIRWVVQAYRSGSLPSGSVSDTLNVFWANTSYNAVSSSGTNTLRGFYFTPAVTGSIVGGTQQIIAFESTTGSVLIGGNSQVQITGSLNVSGSGRFTNGLTVTGSFQAPTITGSLQGTSSYALSASYASTANYAASTPVVPSILFTQGYLTGDQSIPNSSDTIINFERQYDPNLWLDLATRRFTPTVAGYYSVSFGTWLENPASPTNQVNVQIRKSTSGGPPGTVMILQQPLNNGTGISLSGTRILYMDGALDYLDFTIFQGSGSPKNLLYGGTPEGAGTWFSAHLITM
jgi:hypothetical protein